MIVKKIISDLIEFGEVQRAFIGIKIQERKAKKARLLNMDKVEGVFVAGTIEGGAASDVGIMEGDIITHIEQKIINSMSELQEQIGNYRPGDKIGVSILRDKKPMHYEIILRNRHGNTELLKTNENSIMGANLSNLENSELQKLKIRNGVEVLEIVEGKFKDAGIKKGFIIKRINHSAVYEIEDVFFILNSTNGGVFIEGIYPNGVAAYYAFGK